MYMFNTSISIFKHNIQITRDKTNNMTGAYIDDLDQPENLLSLIRVSDGRPMGNSIMLTCYTLIY